MKLRRRFYLNLSSISVLSVTAAVIAAVSVCILIFGSIYSKALNLDARVSSEQAVAQAELAVSNYFDSVEDKLNLIGGVVSQAQTPGEFEDKISFFTYVHNDIVAVTVYSEGGNIISCMGSGGKRKTNTAKDLSFDKELFDNSDGFAVSSPHVQTLFEGEYPWVVTIASKLDAPVFGNGEYVAIDFMFSEIAKYIDNIGIGRHGYCFITDKNGDIVYHPQQQLLFSGLKSENTEFISSLPDGTRTEKNIIYTTQHIKNNLWRIVGISFTDELYRKLKEQILMSIIISFLCCALIALILLIVYSRIVNAPVKSLIRAMKRFETDAENFRFSGGTEIVAELNTLSRSFEHMSRRIAQLMDKVRSEETELRKTELKALQAQINPHFLYNTLDSIQWMCERGNTESASKMVGALAKLFRISISRGHELITIKDEMRHAENYLIIQSYRYRNQFTYTFDVDPEVEGYLCNKITVQPLIENAIYHGIDRLIDEGEINISARTADDNQNDIIITVEDNGVGMTDEQCRKILQKDRSDSGGIGVKNVNDRLKIYFGAGYGLTIKSEPDVGTKVMVRIPKITEEAAANEANNKNK